MAEVDPMAITRADTHLNGGGWARAQEVEAATWVCGYCSDKVSSIKGWWAGEQADGSGRRLAWVRICPSCQGATYFSSNGRRCPGNAPGDAVRNVPINIAQLYEEARASAAAGAYTSTVLTCRKILMHIAVEEGAQAGKNFVTYVEYLANSGYIPPNGKIWVDYIRTRSNEANHEIVLMEESDAIALVTFVEMLLRFIYEFPNSVPPAEAGAATVTQQSS
jgi:hypothetical protein